MSEGRDFWSKRRAAVAAQEEADAEAQAAAAEADEVAALEEKSDEEILAELDLPDPDELKMGDDVTGFMSRAVPERLRRRALRRLWRLNPILANVDGLVDYGEDFTDSATVIDGMQTTYQVGKGMLAHVKEMARQAEEEALAEAKEADEATSESDAETDAYAEVAAQEDLPPAHASAIPEDAESPAIATSQDAENPTETDTSTTLVAERRPRMRFAFGPPQPMIDATTGTS